MATGPAARPASAGIEARGEMTLADYWHERVALHHEDSYAGVPMLKFPEDLRMYERLIWESKPEAILEVGCLKGGSTLWLRDRMAAAAAYGAPPARVVAIDVDISQARENLAQADPGFERSIELVEGDVLSDATTAAVRDMLGDASCMVIEDSAHTFETTLAALKAFSDLVPEGGFFIVEDGYVDVEWMRPSSDWPRGVQRAIEEWLESEGASFRRRRDLEKYILTCHPGGILQRSVTDSARVDADRLVTNPESMTGYENTVRRLEARIADEENRTRAASAALESSEDERRLTAEALEATRTRLNEVEAQIDSMHDSASWKLTAPLRRMKRFFR